MAQFAGYLWHGTDCLFCGKPMFVPPEEILNPSEMDFSGGSFCYVPVDRCNACSLDWLRMEPLPDDSYRKCQTTFLDWNASVAPMT